MTKMFGTTKALRIDKYIHSGSFVYLSVSERSLACGSG